MSGVISTCEQDGGLQGEKCLIMALLYSSDGCIVSASRVSKIRDATDSHHMPYTVI